VETTDSRLFREYHPSATGPSEHFCPSCWSAREKRQQRFGLLFTAGLILGGVVAVAVFPAGQATPLARLVLMLVGFEIMATVLHELGHAAVGRAVGLRVEAISFGDGAVVSTAKILGCEWQIRGLPLCGFVRTAGAPKPLPRLRLWLCTAGGPAVNAALLAAAWWGCGGLWPGELAIEQVSAWHVMAVVNAVVLVFNLVPMMYPDMATMGPALRCNQPNDGMLLVLQAFAPKAAVTGVRADAIESEALAHADAGDQAAARRVADRVFDAPAPPPAEVVAAARICLEVGDDGAARRAAEPLLQDKDPAVAAGAAAVMAVSLLWGGDEDLRAAERLSAQAMERFPGDHAVTMARGRVLLARGWAAKATAVFHAAMGLTADDRARARCACWLARTELAQSDPHAAHNHLALASELAPGCPLVAAVEDD